MGEFSCPFCKATLAVDLTPAQLKPAELVPAEIKPAELKPAQVNGLTLVRNPPRPGILYGPFNLFEGGKFVFGPAPFTGAMVG